MNMYRCRDNKVVAGVCGGMAQHLGWSPFRLRVIWVLATIFTVFAGIIVCLALWFLMPLPPAYFPQR